MVLIDKLKRFGLGVLLMLPLVQLSAQELDVARLRNQRWRMIDLYQFVPGINIEHNVNMVVIPSLAVGIGTFRNLLNYEVGVGYEILNPLPKRSVESLNLHSITPFVSASFNFARWRTGSVYLGADVAYTAAVRTRHHLSNDISVHDRNISNAHLSVSARAGIKVNYWNLSVYYRYSLAPAFDQKHIYESQDYNFDLLYDSIYERSRFGFCLKYHLAISHL